MSGANASWIDTRPVRDLLRVSWQVLALATLAGLIAGVGNAGLLAFINQRLQQGELAASGLIFVGLCLLVLVAAIAAEVLLVYLAQDSIFHLRIWLSHRVLAVPYPQLQQHGPHRILAALTEDVSNVAHAFEALPPIVIEGAIVLATLAYLAWLSWSVLLLVLAFILIGGVAFLWPQTRAVHWLHRARDTEDGLFKHLRTMTEGNKELKMDVRRRRAFMQELLEPTAETMRGHNKLGLTIYTIAMQLGNLLLYLAAGAVLFLAPMWLEVTPAVLSGYALGIFSLMLPLSIVMHSVPALERGLVALRKIESLGLSFEHEPEAAGAGQRPNTAEAPEWIRLSGVQHRYRTEQDESSFMLGPLDVAIPPGELVFITGGNGSGKTTFAMLLLGLYSAESGSIELGQRRLDDSWRDEYRQQFSAVFAEPFVFESLLGYTGAAVQTQAEQWLGRLRLAAKVRCIDGRFSTIDLSKGQRKRLALLAAYIEDRPYYVFDEWAADQDPVFKETFYRELLPGLKARGKTVLVISHDTHYAGIADRLLHFEDGRIGTDSAGRQSRGAHATAPRYESP